MAIENRVGLRRHVNVSMLLVCLITLIGAPEAPAQEPDTEREKVILTGQHADVQYLAGRSVTVKATVSDDVFAAGRDVTLDNAAVSNAIIGGYDVEQRGGKATDFVAVAVNLKLSGTIEDDLVAGARSIRITSDGSVGGDVRFAAETIDVEGRIGGSLRAVAQRITIAGETAGKVDLLARRIVVGPNAVIGGDLIYRGKQEPEIADGATIKGKVRQISIELPDFRPIGWAILGFGLLIGLGWALALVLLVIIVHAVFPHLMVNSARDLRQHPWSSLGRGIAIGLVASAIAGALMMSIFGIPIGGAFFMAIGIAWIVGFASVSAYVGLGIRALRRAGQDDVQPRTQMWWAVLGAILLGIVLLIPVLGWIVAGLAIAAGFGAACREIWQRLRHA